MADNPKTEISVELPAIENKIDEVSALMTDVDAIKENGTEILKEIRECRTRLESLNQSVTAENPLLNQLANRIAEMSSTLDRLNSQILQNLKASQSPKPNESNPPKTEEIPPEPGEPPNPVVLIEEPVKDAPPPPKTQARFRRL